MQEMLQENGTIDKLLAASEAANQERLSDFIDTDGLPSSVLHYAHVSNAVSLRQLSLPPLRSPYSRNPKRLLNLYQVLLLCFYEVVWSKAGVCITRFA